VRPSLTTTKPLSPRFTALILCKFTYNDVSTSQVNTSKIEGVAHMNFPEVWNIHNEPDGYMIYALLARQFGVHILSDSENH
jgi:hypothetical protein